MLSGYRSQTKLPEDNKIMRIKNESIEQNSGDLSLCFQVVFYELGWVPEGHDIAMDLNISSDRKEVTCSIGGQCAKCIPQNETILLNVEGKSYSIYFF